MRRRRVPRIAMLLVLSLALGSVSACASTKKSLSPQAQLATRVSATISDLEQRLNQRDPQRIISLLAPPLAEDKTFTQAIDSLVNKASTLQAEFVIERLWLQSPDLPAARLPLPVGQAGDGQGQAGTVRVDLHWTLRAELKEGPTTTTGTTRFTMVGKDHPLLSAVSGDNPFDPQFEITPAP